jgi:hypothetical protein
MYGKVTVGSGTSQQREIEISEFLQANFKDNRLASVIKLEDGSFICGVENPSSSGRNAQSTIWLTKESLIGMIATAALYFKIKGEDLQDLIEDSAQSEDIEYRYSDNLCSTTSKEL